MRGAGEILSLVEIEKWKREVIHMYDKTRYPYDPKGGGIQSDVEGIALDRIHEAHLQYAAADVPAASDDGVHEALICADGVESWLDVGLTSPAVPRGIRIKGNAASVTGDFTVEGTNYADEDLSEVIAANGIARVDGLKAFKTVTRLGIPARGAPGDTISVGWSDILGLPVKMAHNLVGDCYLNNVKEATPTVTFSATAIESNTVKLASALNGSVVDIYLKVY